MQYAILIDAGFIKYKLGTSSEPMTVLDVRALVKKLSEHSSLKEHKLHRVYYYDAMPLTTKETVPLSSTVKDFAANTVAKRSIDVINQIKKEPFFSVRLGELSFEGWQIKQSRLNTKSESISISSDDLKPKISQKGVDMRIGMDMASLTLKRIAQILVLVTGDSDFVPAMKFARREGAEVYIVTLGHKIKDSMLEHSDLLIDLDPVSIRNMASKINAT